MDTTQPGRQTASESIPSTASPGTPFAPPEPDPGNNLAEITAYLSNPLAREDLARLQTIPATADLEAELARDMDAWDYLNRQPRDLDMQRFFVRSRSVIEYQLAVARVRDAIAATRPEGCWCLGAGGRDLFPNQAVRDENRVPVLFFHEYCECPEGLAALAEQAALFEKAIDSGRRKRIALAWEYSGLVGEQLDWRFSTHPLKDADPEWWRHEILPLIRQVVIPGNWRSLYLWGEAGGGKTGVAVAYLRRFLVGTERSIAFTTSTALSAELKATYDGAPINPLRGNERAVLGHYATVDMLVLDDLGAEQITGNGWLQDRLIQIIEPRYLHKRPTVFTSNYSPSQMAERIGSRLASRILHMAGAEGTIQFDTADLRYREVVQRARG